MIVTVSQYFEKIKSFFYKKRDLITIFLSLKIIISVALTAVVFFNSDQGETTKTPKIQGFNFFSSVDRLVKTPELPEKQLPRENLQKRAWPNVNQIFSNSSSEEPIKKLKQNKKLFQEPTVNQPFTKYLQKLEMAEKISKQNKELLKRAIARKPEEKIRWITFKTRDKSGKLTRKYSWTKKDVQELINVAKIRVLEKRQINSEEIRHHEETIQMLDAVEAQETPYYFLTTPEWKARLTALHKQGTKYQGWGKKLADLITVTIREKNYYQKTKNSVNALMRGLKDLVENKDYYLTQEVVSFMIKNQKKLRYYNWSLYDKNLNFTELKGVIKLDEENWTFDLEFFKKNLWGKIYKRVALMSIFIVWNKNGGKHERLYNFLERRLLETAQKEAKWRLWQPVFQRIKKNIEMQNKLGLRNKKQYTGWCRVELINPTYIKFDDKNMKTKTTVIDLPNTACIWIDRNSKIRTDWADYVIDTEMDGFNNLVGINESEIIKKFKIKQVYNCELDTCPMDTPSTFKNIKGLIIERREAVKEDWWLSRTEEKEHMYICKYKPLFSCRLAYTTNNMQSGERVLTKLVPIKPGKKPKGNSISVFQENETDFKKIEWWVFNIIDNFERQMLANSNGKHDFWIMNEVFWKPWTKELNEAVVKAKNTTKRKSN